VLAFPKAGVVFAPPNGEGDAAAAPKGDALGATLLDADPNPKPELG
jgi:hypothetical protein